MGIPCSKNFNGERVNAVGKPFASGEGSHSSYAWSGRLTDLAVDDQQPEGRFPNHNGHNYKRGSEVDDFYDGIPLVPTVLSHKSRSTRSTQAAVSKVSEVSLRLGRVGTVGLEKAVEVLDVLGSSMTDLNSRSGFASGVLSKGTKISILAFEVANTIMKGACLMHSLSESHIHHLKEEVLPSEAVQKLVSKDMDELLKIVARDKREELALFSGEVIRFGNRCKDPQWHNLDRYFSKQSCEISRHKQLKEDAESVMQQMMILVKNTAELYHELHALHRYEQDYQSKSRVEAGNHGILREEFTKQKKLVQKLKKRSLWSRSLEEIMEKLVDVVLFLHTEIHSSLHSDGQCEDATEPAEGPTGNFPRLGPAGLALHYANIILQIDAIVARSSCMAPNARESLYQSLPPSIKSSLRSKLQSFHVKEELTVTETKAEMEKTLQWLVPIASNTIKSHHGFGWVGEWANSGFEANEQPSIEKADLIRIETLYHADKMKTEAYITDQLVWLHYLVSQSRMTSLHFSHKPTTSPLQRKQFSEPNVFCKPTELLTAEDQNTQDGIDTQKQALEDCEDVKNTTGELKRTCDNSSESRSRENKDLPMIEVA